MLYEVITQLNEYKFVADVLPPSASFNKVRPVRVPNAARTAFNTKWTISSGYSPDSISGMPYAIRTDTLMKYLVVEDGCTASVNYVDGIERPDLKYGDQLVVTAVDGSKKSYKITPNPYYPERNAYLETVVFPGLNLFLNTTTYDLSSYNFV